jgi:hypothetical protein
MSLSPKAPLPRSPPRRFPAAPLIGQLRSGFSAQIEGRSCRRQDCFGETPKSEPDWPLHAGRPRYSTVLVAPRVLTLRRVSAARRPQMYRREYLRQGLRGYRVRRMIRDDWPTLSEARKFARLSPDWRCFPTRSLQPRSFTLITHAALMLVPATLAELPCTRAMPDRDVFYVCHDVATAKAGRSSRWLHSLELPMT